MSVENHPNFHAAQFAAVVTRAYFDALRGKATKESAPDITYMLLNFIDDIEDLVDLTCCRLSDDPSGNVIPVFRDDQK